MAEQLSRGRHGPSHFEPPVVDYSLAGREAIDTQLSLPRESMLPSISTSQLCLAWQVSYTQLERSSRISDFEEIVRLRHHYLDELQRRDPSAFERWFPTASAAVDPTPFFCAGAA